jgi:ABC-type multidrug transport system permease subunit
LVPISGRNGIHSNPDLLVAMVTVAFGLLITAFIVGFLSLDI